MTPRRIGELEIIRRLGAGGFGVVYLAQDHRLGRRVALKLAHPGRGDLEREARAAAKLAHPNVVAIHELGMHEGTPFLVMEFVEGPTLRERLAGGAMPLREALRIARDLAAALTAAHAEGVMHLDLTPSNVLLAADGRARVVDFGLARATDNIVGDGIASSVAGTPSYMAPEQWRREAVSTAADIWSFGMMLHVLAVGRLPIEGSTDAIHDAVAGSAELCLDGLEASPFEAIVRACLAKAPGARPRASEIATQLAALGEASPFVGPRPLPAGAPYIGRTALVTEVAEALIDEPAVLIAGAPGAGKTSFVHAGLTPVLRARGYRVIAFGGGGLATALHRALPGAATATRTGELAETSLTPERFAAELADAADATGKLAVIVELDELSSARDALAAAIADPGAARIICCSRDRAIARALGIARVVELPPPTRGELARMLVEPLRDAGITLDAALADRIAGDLVTKPDAQALVQLVGTELWNNRRDQRVTEYPAILAPAKRRSRWRIAAPCLIVAAVVPFIIASSRSAPGATAKPASQCEPWVFATARMATAFNDPAIQDSFAGISHDARTVLTLRRNCNVDELYTPTIVDLDDGGTPITLDLTKTIVKTGFHELEGFMTLPDERSVIGVMPDSRGFGITRRSARGLADFGPIETADYAALAVTAPYWVQYPIQSADGLAFYYVINSEADHKHHVMMQAERPSRDVPFGPPKPFEDPALHARDGAHVTGISADRLTVILQINYTTIAHARPSVDVPFDNPRKPIGEPPIQGFRTMPVGACEMLVGTCVGGCMQEDTCFFGR